MVEVGKLLRDRISATLISTQANSTSLYHYPSVEAITITGDNKLCTSNAVGHLFQKNNIKGCKQSNFKYGSGRRQQPLCPLRILPQQGKCGSACALILPAICRGSHETNTVITCPGQLLCSAAAPSAGDPRTTRSTYPPASSRGK